MSTTPPRPAAAATVAALEARLDRLPWRGPASLAVLVVAGSYLFDFYDQVSIGAVAKPLRATLGIGLEAFGFAVSVSYAGLLLGALLGGWLADRIGRRSVLIGALVLVSAGSGLVGLLATDLPSLVATRAVVGIGMGVLYPVALTYMVELLPARRRGRAVAIAFFFGSVGNVLANQAALWLVPLGPDGWRWVFGAGAAGLIIILPVLRLPESPRWLLARGHQARAEAALALVERQAGNPVPPAYDAMFDADTANAADTGAASRGRAELLRRPYLAPLLLLSVAWIAQTGATLAITQFTPTVLDLRGFPVATALTVASTITLGMLAGSLIAFAAGERLGGARGAALACMVAGLASATFGLSTSIPLIVAGGFLTWLAMGVFTPLLLRAMSEQWPSQLRARGNGIAFSTGRVAAILAPLVLVTMITAFGVDSAGWTTLALWAVTALAMGALARRRAAP